MCEDFKEKLDLFREGKLSPEAAGEIQLELDRYTAIKEYLDEQDNTFVEELKVEMERNVPSGDSVVKKINKRIVFKISKISIVTILVCVILLPMLYLSVLSVLGSTFRVDSDRFLQEQDFTRYFIHMAFPEVYSPGGNNSTDFYKQTFTCKLVKGIGHEADQQNIEVRYFLGKLKKPEIQLDERLNYYSGEMFHAVDPKADFKSTDWGYLEKAPAGTRAQIFITFKDKFTPEQTRSVLGDQYFKPGRDFTVDLLAYTGSSLILANTYYYNQNRNPFSNTNNETHKEVMLFGLKQIKKFKNIAGYLSENYTYDMEEDFSDIDINIEYVEKNGVQYVGAIISGDAKELLNLKSNSEIAACRVEDIVVW